MLKARVPNSQFDAIYLCQWGVILSLSKDVRKGRGGMET
jgi:hypothetical protein